MSLKNARPNSSDTALTWVRDALKASFPTTTVQVRRPAVVVNFAGGAERWEIVPAFRQKSDNASPVYWIPGAATGWLDSAPLDHIKYVNEVNSKAGIIGGAKKLARLAKAWKYSCNVPISSFYLEMRAAKYMETEKSFEPIWDVARFLKSLHDGGLANMNDPKGLAGRFAPCSSTATWIDAYSKLSTAATRANKALEAQRANNPVEAFHYLNLLFGGTFPSR